MLHSSFSLNPKQQMIRYGVIVSDSGMLSVFNKWGLFGSLDIKSFDLRKNFLVYNVFEVPKNSISILNFQ